MSRVREREERTRARESETSKASLKGISSVGQLLKTKSFAEKKPRLKKVVLLRRRL